MTSEQRATVIKDAEDQIRRLNTTIQGRKEHIELLKKDLRTHEHELAGDEVMVRTQQALIAFIKTDTDPA